MVTQLARRVVLLAAVYGIGGAIGTALLGLAALAGCVPKVAADDRADRERKVKVALALSGTDFHGPSKPVVATAPPPRAQEPKPYAAGYERSVAEHIPLVVYVGCTGPRIEGAATVRTENYPGVAAPAVVVGYPQGDRLIQDRTLPATATPEEIRRAAADALKKVPQPLPKDKPVAPAPLNWMIGTGPAPV